MAKEPFISSANAVEAFQAEHIPKQNGPPASDASSVRVYISTYPALGQTTQIDRSTSVLTALLEVDECRVVLICLELGHRHILAHFLKRAAR